jgi:glycosyltransferase involved in cell wall biosynthesis
VQRWLKIIKYLIKSGFNVTIIVPENADYPVTDSSLENDIPHNVHVIEVPINEPSRWASKLSRKRTKTLQKGILSKKSSRLENLLLWLRGNFFIPDARIGWKVEVVKAGSKFLLENPQTTLITSGPPHSIHLSGMELKKQFSELQWIADFRDPWTTIGYHKDLKLGKRAKQKHLKLEHEVLNTADKILVTSKSTQQEFRQKTYKEVVVITNGFDTEVSTVLTQPEGKFTLSHIGTLLADRNPEILWKVVSELCHENTEFSKHVIIQLAGNVSDDVVDSIKKVGLSEKLQLLGYVDHENAITLMRKSQCLLLIEIDSEETRAILPGKLFEYLASRRSILALGPDKSDIQAIIEDNKAGAYFTYSDRDKLKGYLQELFKQYLLQENTGNQELTFLKYHRRETTQQLINEIEKSWE